MTTDRFYGGVDGRLEVLARMLSFLEESDGEAGVPRNKVVEWILRNTNARESEAVTRHLYFIEAIELIEGRNDRYAITWIGECYLEERDPLVLYNTLRTNVKGFDTLLRALSREPRTDEDLMELLVAEFEECNMETPAVAARHREWLQAIGYVEHENDRNRLTPAGEAVAKQLRETPSVDFELGRVYERQQLHNEYGGGRQSGIAPSRDAPVVFLFSGGSGTEHGYHDEFRSDGSVIYTGEGQVGDMKMVRGNRAIRDHVEEGRELHLFEMVNDGVRYRGQFMYAGHFFEELPDSNGNRRDAIRFKLAPVDEVASSETVQNTLETVARDVRRETPNQQHSSEPTVYQVPVKTIEGPIRTNFRRTVLEGVPRSQLEHVCEIPIDHETVRVWGNQADEPADRGDYLLFADREGRHGGEYTILARVEHAIVLDENRAKAFTDAVGWGEVTDDSYPHVMFLEPVYETTLDRERFWDVLGFKGWPNDTFSAINFERDGSTFFEEYDSIRAFVEQITARALYPNEATADPVDEYDSLEHAIEDVRTRLERAPRDATWLQERLGEAIVVDWSSALAGFDPSDEIEAGAAGKFDQLRTIYESLERELEAAADELGVGSLGEFTPAPTLFLAWFRLVQGDGGVTDGLLTRSRLESVLRNDYAVETDSDDTPPRPTDPHPLTAHVHETKPTVYKFTAPPDYWLTTVEYGSVSVEDRHRDRWEEFQPGDVAILHSRAEPSSDDLATQPSGLIGVGVLGEKFEKDEPWWLDEHETNAEFPLRIAFDRLFLTGDVDEIDTSRSIAEKTPDEIDRESAALAENCLPIDRANEICERASADGTAFPVQSMFATFRTADDRIDRDRPAALIEAMKPDLEESPAINVHSPYRGALPTDVLEGLYFGDDLGRKILEQIETALRSGKHVLLTGPPGTGKTEIARKVCRHLTKTHPYLYTDFEITTATADWSTFDTVGGYMPDESADGGDELSFKPGLVLNRLKDAQTKAQANELIVVDELNRADIDKAFGQLFTLLSGQSVQLPYTENGREIEITTAEELHTRPETHQYLVPNSWRIFATMNAYDKTSLYEMSYAFMRRFAFVRVPAPDLPSGDSREDEEALERIVDAFANAWDIETGRNEKAAVGHVWRATNQAVDERSIGPAIVEDVLRYVTQHPEEDLKYHLTQAVVSYVLPQLEGVPKRRQIVRKIADVPEIDETLLERAAREMLQVALTEAE